MQIWSLTGIIEKNKLANDMPFLLLVQVEHNSLAEPIRLARNTEDVAWNGQTWYKFPLEIDSITQDGKEVPSLNLKVSNISGVIQTYIQKYGGFVDATVTLYIIHAAHLDNTTPEFSITLSNNMTQYDENWVTFALTSDKDFSWQYPPNKYNRDFCRWKFKSVRCGYTGSASACNGTLSTCRIMSRFGGEPGVESGS
ncbi:DUF1833 family protein [Pectinatus frisingensis]|uniref:DUF1833 family protein n=1 Tax=Pectinatus frisingensis TaxID=865 RepID=UPI0018C46C0A|nr:DUF1833 family protein [Pectinatus frisingensis]